MPTQYINIIGTASWAQVYEPDAFMGSENWKMNIYPQDEQEWDKYVKAGIQKARKENNDPAKGPIGEYFQTTRPTHKVINGEMVRFVGPTIYNADGEVIVDYINKETNKRVNSYSPTEQDSIVRRGSPVLIGNGSKVRVGIAVYDTMKGKGQRLESVTVLDLVEYQKDSGELPPVLSDVVTPVTPTGPAEKKPTGNKKVPW